MKHYTHENELLVHLKITQPWNPEKIIWAIQISIFLGSKYEFSRVSCELESKNEEFFLTGSLWKESSYEWKFQDFASGFWAAPL